METRNFVELLEPRIAPASVFTFTDVDGDRVKIISNVGDLNAPGVITKAPGGFVGGEQLALLDLRDPSFQGAVLTTKVTKAQGGDGLVHIGRIEATGRDLEKVIIKGDLGAIDVGDSDTTSAALKLLKVRSMGRFGLSTQSGLVDLISNVQGALGKVVIAGDFKEAQIVVAPGGSIGSITIGGSIIGGATDRSGWIEVNGDIGSVKVGRDILGGGGLSTGSIFATGKIGAVTVGHSVYGGSGALSARIATGSDLGPVKIGGDLVGGDGGASGVILANGKLKAFTIGGSMVGGTGVNSSSVTAADKIGPVKIGDSVLGGAGGASGLIYGSNPRSDITSITIGGSVVGGTSSSSAMIITSGNIGAIRIGGDLRGGSISGTDSTISQSGYISGDRIASITVGGSIIAGQDNSTHGTLLDSGAIRVNDDIGRIVIKGSIVGNETNNGTTHVIISARGQETLAPGAKTDIAIKSLTVGGHVELAKILGGFSPSFSQTTGSNGNASIGPVRVGGDWYASSISAGVQDGAAVGFGDGGDTVINNATDAIIARIASIKIKGVVVGAPNPFFQNAFIAQQIGSFKAGAFTAPLTAGTDARIFLTAYTGNISIVEV